MSHKDRLFALLVVAIGLRRESRPQREPDHANAYRHAVGSADVAVDRTASGRGQEPSQVWWRQLAMRQLGEGVQSEERQMLLPFLFPRHLSLRPAAASWQNAN